MTVSAAVFDLSGVGGLTPSGASQSPQVSIDHHWFSQKIHQKYIADPLWLYHKLSTAENTLEPH